MNMVFHSQTVNRKLLSSLEARCMSKVNTILEECDQCKKEVVISYECPQCKLRVCMLCAIENNWECPKCGKNLI